MGIIGIITSKLPAVESPKIHLNFKNRLKWTGIILILFLVMGQITVFGVSREALERFSFFELVLGSSMGSLMTLGIGPIVTASIILQLLVGSGLLPFDLHSREGRAKFQGIQKLLSIIFCLFEAFAFASFGGFVPVGADMSVALSIIGQLALGGILVLIMDEVVSKWGIGSGVSLFIAAGVTRQIFVMAFNPLTPAGSTIPAGLIPGAIGYLGIGEIYTAIISLLPIIATLLVFLIVVYVDAIKVEIPLAFASIRGFGQRWPLKFIYTSNMPVILVAALLANIQLLGGGQNGEGILASITHFLTPPTEISVQVLFLIALLVIFAVNFLAFYFKQKNSMRILFLSVALGMIAGIAVSGLYVGLPTMDSSIRIVTYLLFFMAGSTIFSMFWVSTAGMDSASVAKQIQSIGMQIPGFRRDPRIVESVLNRYIPVLAVLGGLFVGLLAAVADLTNALGSGTGILLTVMIMFNMYEQISRHYVEDMHPAMRKFFE